jgi:2-polyprenyl-3-methyl-5-hydroxy-6-metoxy-1,4-benzoquinol methylase
MTCGQALTKEQRLSARLLDATVHALELTGVYLGKRLGFYTALQSATATGGLSVPELARRTRVAERYAREWLEQQAVAGLLQVDNSAAAAGERRFSLPPEHAGVLADDDHPSHMAPLAMLVAGIGAVLPRVVDAYRSGGGVPYDAYGADFRHGQAGINRPAFLHDLSERWLPALPDVHTRLLTKPKARIADVGCGLGWSTIALARAYPNADVVGYDLDAASIEEAEENGRRHGVNARFVQKNAATIARDGPFDLVVILEALHDMAHPVQSLAAIRSALDPNGAVMVADERVAERFHAPGDDIERLMYGWSIVHCLPVAMAEQPSDAIGTVIRADTVKAAATQAGFARIDVLPFESEFFRFYRLGIA